MSEPLQYDIELDGTPEAALDRLAALAEDWDAAWQWEGPVRGRLGLPVLAGVRRGWVAGPVIAEAVDSERARLVFTVDAEDFKTDRGSVAVLLVAAFFGLMTLIAPFFPRLWSILPVSIVIVLATWFFVVARLRNSGPEEFLELLDQASEAIEP
ncbi:MAG: hypothetical protein AAGE94_02205 [Acidobacteriota bacterium]